MGFILSFLLILTFGFWSYWAYHQFGLPKGRQGFLAWYALLTVGTLMIIDFLIYFGFFDFLWPILDAYTGIKYESGRDFMWNDIILEVLSPIGFIPTDIDYKNDDLTWFAFILILSYPMLFKFYSNGSRMLFGGNNPHQKGMYYLFEPTKKPKEGQKVAKQPEKT